MEIGDPPEDFDSLERNTGMADINSLENRLAIIRHKKSSENDERTLNSSLSGSSSEKAVPIDIKEHKC